MSVAGREASLLRALPRQRHRRLARRVRAVRGAWRGRVVDGDRSVQDRRRITRRVGHAHEEAVRAVAQLRSVKTHVRTHRRKARLHVQERRQAVRRLADVLAAPVVFVEHVALHDLPVNREHSFVHARARIRCAEGHVRGAAHRGIRRQFAAHVRRSWAHRLFEDQIRRVHVHNCCVAVGITGVVGAGVFGHAAAGRLHVKMGAEITWRDDLICRRKRLTDFPRTLFTAV